MDDGSKPDFVDALSSELQPVTDGSTDAPPIKRNRLDLTFEAECEFVKADVFAGSSLRAEAVLREAFKTEPLDDLSGPAPSDLYEPSEPMIGGEQVVEGAVALLANEDDNEKAVSSAATHHMSSCGIKLPWETDFAKAIFGDQVPDVQMSSPMDWSGRADPRKLCSGADDVGEQPKTLDCSIRHCVKNVSDRTYTEQREAATVRATNKILVLIRLAPDKSSLGRQLQEESDDPIETLRAVIGVKSPHTIIKRVNSVLSFYRWCATQLDEACFPIDERMVWKYIQFLRMSGAAPTRAQSFVQALRFSYYTFGLDGCLEATQSRRILGGAELQWSLKKPAEQARPLKVYEVLALHHISRDETRALADRVMASNIVMMVYGRCRNSDVQHVYEVLHDHANENGFFEFTTQHHKGSKSAQKKARLMPVLIDTMGIVDGGWIQTWISVRKEAGLATSGLVDGALVPAPFFGKELCWSRRPMRTEETTAVLRNLLHCNDELLTSHSLKATALSWASKAGVPREVRQVLGRHTSAVEGSDTFYSRDLCVEPVRALARVCRLIRDGLFHPDSDRSNYFSFDHGQFMNFQPSTPTFLGVRPGNTDQTVAPRTPAAVSTPGPQPESEAVVKSEKCERTFCQEGGLEDFIFIDSSSAQSDCDSTDSEGTSSSEECEGSTTRRPVQRVTGSGDAWPVYNTWVKHKRSKVCHRFESLSEPVEGDLSGKVTACGRKLLDRYEMCGAPGRFDPKCKMCMKMYK
ncbi:Protein-lysine methyltransferase METTL21B [Durusdinium trenchii]|uniref:Protein-lysine methyltransferase METTL21B n=1 Tax=Durusdinium trenchii TaxID=1381693 RepID=A0ABP0SNE9_9DINO